MADSIEWLSTNRAADYLGITNRTVYRLIDDGGLPAYKIGRVIRLKQTDVDKFIEASRVQPGTLNTSTPRRRPNPKRKTPTQQPPPPPMTTRA